MDNDVCLIKNNMCWIEHDCIKCSNSNCDTKTVC